MAFPSDDQLARARDAEFPGQSATGRIPVRLSRDRTISPTLLKMYRECPHRVRLHYIEQIRTPRQYEHHLSQGIIAHNLLAMMASRLKAGIAPIDHADLHSLASRRVPSQVFPSPEYHDDAVNQIVRWVETGRRYLQCDPDAEIVLIERPQKRVFGPDDPLQLTFRSDLVRRTADSDGEYLDVIDFKTGKRWTEEHVPVIARFVINSWLEREGERAWNVPARFTWVWLETGEQDTVALDPESCTAPWQSVRTLVDRLFAETDWLPTPSLRCRWCPFHRIACAGDDAADTTAPGPLFGGPGASG